MHRFPERQLLAIEANPIGNGLDAFRTALESKYPNISHNGDFPAVEKLSSDANLKGFTLLLLGVLQLHPVASILTYGDNGPLIGEIALLYARISSDQTDVRYTMRLVLSAATPADDKELWAGVYDAIAQTKPKSHPNTPPPSGPSFASSFQQTPWSFNTSFVDSSELRKDIDPILRNELDGNLTIDHPEFVDAFFGKVSRLDEIVDIILLKCQDMDPSLYQEGSGWLEWPDGCKESDVLQWLRRHIDLFLSLAKEHGLAPSERRRCFTTPTKPIPGSVSRRKLDVGIAYEGNDEAPMLHVHETARDWSRILVAGELKSNLREDIHRNTWLDLARYTREIFGAQDRRFVLGFTLCGTKMRLWEFDRLGGVASLPFDVNDDGKTFIQVILGFFLMSDKQLGFDPTIQTAGGQRSIKISRGDQSEKLILTQLIRKHPVITSRATTCWKAFRDGDKSKKPLIIKDSWQYKERPEEGLLIREATEKSVRNISRYYYHETVQVDGNDDDIINGIRGGLVRARGRDAFEQDDTLYKETADESSQVSSQTEGRSSPRKRSLSSAQMPPPSRKKSRLSRRSTTDDKSLHDRIHRRVITQDSGKTLYEASTLSAFIQGLIGAICGHESLLNVGILHRDISAGNIMLSEEEDDGFLIDLDLAVMVETDKASGAPSKTGTKIFMAIGALYGEHHNFMHDLESFFWVLFWICIHWDGPGRRNRRVKEFDNWNYKPTEELAKIKIGQVSEEDRFEKELSENISDYCKPLVPWVKELRTVIFPGGKRWLSEDRALYSQLKAVLERAKKDHGVLAK